MNRLIVLVLLSLALVPATAAQGPMASSFSDCNPVWNVTLDDAHGCDEGIAAPRSDAPGRSPAHGTLVPVQDGAQVNRVLVAQIYDDLARGDLPAVVAVLDDGVVWSESGHGPEVGRYVGPGVIAAHILLPQVTTRRDADALDSLFLDGDQVIAVGTTHRDDPATGRLTLSRFRHVWQVRGGRVVYVHRAYDL